MEKGARYLAWSTARALVVANARKPLATSGLGGVLAFASGLPTSELAREHAVAYLGSAAAAVARGAHHSTAGKVGLGLTVGAAGALIRMHHAMSDVDRLVEVALADQLGVGHRSELAPPPMAPRTTALPLLPTPVVRQRFLHDGHVEYGEFGRRTTLDVWRRPDLPEDAGAPVLIWVHGGAWISGDKEGQGYPLMTHLAERGWVCVSVTYRLSPRATWPDHIVDVKRAIGWVRANIAEHGGDPGWLAISGGSAGGHLCSLAALTPNDPQFQPSFEDVDTSVDVAVPFYGVYDWTNRDDTGRADTIDFLAARVVKQPFASASHVYEQASPMTHVDEHAVPMMLVHGTNDTLVPVAQARSMVDLLRARSANPVVYLELPGAQHAFDAFGSRRTAAVVDGVARFLDHQRAGAGTADQASSTT